MHLNEKVSSVSKVKNKNHCQFLDFQSFISVKNIGGDLVKTLETRKPRKRKLT